MQRKHNKYHFLPNNSQCLLEVGGKIIGFQDMLTIMQHYNVSAAVLLLAVKVVRRLLSN